MTAPKRPRLKALRQVGAMSRRSTVRLPFELAALLGAGAGLGLLAGARAPAGPTGVDAAALGAAVLAPTSFLRLSHARKVNEPRARAHVFRSHNQCAGAGQPRRACEPAGMLRHRRWPAALVAGAAASALLWAQPDPAAASYPHTVLEGETLSGIAAANGMSTETLASFNGISSETYVVIGETVNIPSSTELGTTSTTTTTTSTTSTSTSGPPATRRPPTGPPRSTRRSAPPTSPRAQPRTGRRCARPASPPTASTSTRPARSPPTAPRSSRATSTTSTSRASARRRTRRAPPRTSTGPRSTSPAPRCGPSSTTSAPPTAGARSTAPTSGGTSTTTAAEGSDPQRRDAALEHVALGIEAAQRHVIGQVAKCRLWQEADDLARDRPRAAAARPARGPARSPRRAGPRPGRGCWSRPGRRRRGRRRSRGRRGCRRPTRAARPRPGGRSRRRRCRARR